MTITPRHRTTPFDGTLTPEYLQPARFVDAEVEIVVADNGAGIAPAEREKAFRRFYRLEQSRGQIRGNGLGLSLVSAVAKLHQGSVRLEDNEPGLRVVLSFPRGMAG